MGLHRGWTPPGVLGGVATITLSMSASGLIRVVIDTTAACPLSGTSRTGNSALQHRDRRDSSPRTGASIMSAQFGGALLQQDQAMPARRYPVAHLVREEGAAKVRS